MFVSVHWKKWFEQTNWSVGYCPRCRRAEAIRIGHVVSTTSLYMVLQIARTEGATIRCCDFCGGEAEPYSDADYVDVADWSHRAGVKALFGMCTPDRDPGPPRFSAEAEVDDLLRGVTRATKFTKIDLNAQWLPPLIGACLGIGLALIPAFVSDQPDRVRAVMLALLGGGFAGGLLGIIAGGFYSCERVARTAIEYNARKYQIDGDMLTRMAGGFPGRIRRAVRAVA